MGLFGFLRESPEEKARKQNIKLVDVLMTTACEGMSGKWIDFTSYPHKDFMDAYKNWAAKCSGMKENLDDFKMKYEGNAVELTKKDGSRGYAFVRVVNYPEFANSTRKITSAHKKANIETRAAFVEYNNYIAGFFWSKKC